MTPTIIDGNRIAEELKDGVLRGRERLSERGLWATSAGRLGWHTRRADVLVVAAGVPTGARA